MIIKVNDINNQQLVNENQIYPVLAYRINENEKKEYRIFDEGNSFTWIIDGIEVLSNDESSYYKCIDNSDTLYLYNLLSHDFFLKFYLEDDDIECVLSQLREAMKEIVKRELNTGEIMLAIKQTAVSSDYFPLLLEIFFSTADITKINESMRYFSTICEKLYDDDIKIIVDYVKLIDSDEVKCFYECISQCYNISDDIMNQVYKYLYK